MNDTKILTKRLDELSQRAYSRGYNTFSDFLSLDEISTLHSLKLPQKPTLYGGYENAERCIAGFGDNIEEWDFPIVCIKISPSQQKFADKLSHRDFLGSLMNLGISRSTLGDIKIVDNIGYLFCLESISQYIADSISTVKRTTVNCEIISQLPAFLEEMPEPQEFFASSKRIDAIISSVYKLSRGQASKLISEEIVFINSRVVTKESTTLKDGDVVSVRHYGKFIFDGEIKETKKGRLVIQARVYK